VRLFDIGARRDGSEVVHDRVLTVPNAITLVRLLGVPLFVWLVLGREAYGAAFWTLAAVGGTDWIDGYLARRFDQVSRLGKVMDPLIDRLLLVTASITLVVADVLPWGVLAAIVARDLLLLAGAAMLFGGIPPIAVTRTGKFATACLMIGLPAFLLAATGWGAADLVRLIAWGCTVAGIATYWVAGSQYLRAALDLRSTRP
jgi:cardiolipin synthase (CMP-forming)